MAENLTPQTPGNIALGFYTLLLVMGLALYFGWSILYNTWTDPGLYSICIVVILLGLFGVLLYGKK